ncbi:hypothetical protein HS088_TW03G00163 [Tripterygium wilfordii]|uniref:Uncharacterized protein n=1 Tax=Tripterygium wilfordii TaxID=458696 RepID=A0A7J7DU44_TRIWF|nr:hypothetical protein HS088_TW03G00163 [Tripterygium wilfordii]
MNGGIRGAYDVKYLAKLQKLLMKYRQVIRRMKIEKQREVELKKKFDDTIMELFGKPLDKLSIDELLVLKGKLEALKEKVTQEIARKQQNGSV